MSSKIYHQKQTIIRILQLFFVRFRTCVPKPVYY